MIRIVLCLLIVLWSNAAYGVKEIAITIDDLPFQRGRHLPDSVEADKFRETLSALKKHNVKIIAFVIGSRINANYDTLLDELVDAGHLIGNHTFTHPDLNSTDIDSYQEDIVNCQTAIQKWIGTKKYFRYPYLHQGPTRAKYDSISDFLQANTFINVPVSIDNDDWLFNKHYTEALKLGNSPVADSIGREYLAHMREMTLRFDSIAVAKMHRDIKHILLLHMNELNARYLDELLTWYENSGWRFVAPDEALADSVYKIRDTYIGRNGTSWLLRF
jgi:peptidoglycan/xylan/chitin deacetylase (PgdA/CDA1 family)